MAYYPNKLLDEIAKVWLHRQHKHQAKRPPLPSRKSLSGLLDTCYHASMLREEGRKLSFRVIVCEENDFSRQASNLPVLGRQERILKLSTTRTFSVAELHRLAPAAEAIRSLICVKLDQGNAPEIWGLLDTGANWWNFIHHEASSGSPPPNQLTISSHSPGELIISTDGDILCSLRGGNIVLPSIDILWKGLVSDFLEPSRKRFYSDVVAQLKSKKYDPKGKDDSYPSRFFNFCLWRLLFHIREKAHGGTLILIPDHLSSDDTRLTDRLTTKYQCNHDYTWSLMVQHLVNHRKYYDLYFQLWDSKTDIAPKDFHALQIADGHREKNDEMLGETLRFIASLSAVDGAVIITDRFRVLGFGAEVTALSPSLKTVSISTDCDGESLKQTSIENYGTRHRSAFRFCSSFEDSLAFILSQDGGVKATKRIGPNVLLWPDVNSGSVGI